MWYLYLILAVVVIIAGAIVWYISRKDYRSFEKDFNVKLPFVCYVNKRPMKDAIAWGYRRYRFIRKDGRKDRRRAMNFMVTYPTIITCCQYRVRVWNIEEAKRVFREVQDYMWLQPADLPFYGKIEGSLWNFFHGKRVRFVRYIAKLFEFYNWFPDLLYDQEWDIMLTKKNNYYAVKCVFKKSPVTLDDVMRLPKLVDIVYPVVVTNKYFTEGAMGYCKRNKINMMDYKSIRDTFEYDFVMFIGRQA